MWSISNKCSLVLVMTCVLTIGVLQHSCDAQPVSNSSSFSHFYTIYPDYGSKPFYPIAAKIEQHTDTLYVRVVAGFQSKPISQCVLRDGDAGQDDIIVIIIDPGRTGKDGYAFGINSINTQRDLKISNVDKSTLAWNYNWASNASLDSESWIAEMWIPMRGLVSKSVDSISINILRGFIRCPSGTFEGATLVPFGPGVKLTNVQFTQRIPFKVSGNTKPFTGYALPYVRIERLNTPEVTSQSAYGIEAKVDFREHWLMATYQPDFYFVEANVYSLDYLVNRFFLSENRFFSRRVKSSLAFRSRHFTPSLSRIISSGVSSMDSIMAPRRVFSWVCARP